MIGLKYISWADNTGYAIAAKSYIRALVEAGTAITWSPMLPVEKAYIELEKQDWPCPVLSSVANLDIEYDVVLIHTVPEYYPALIAKERSKGCKVFGYTVWELERLPDHWPAILNQLDGVLVPCQWNVQVFRDSGVQVPIIVVPHLSQFSEVQEAQAGATHQFDIPALDAAISSDRYLFYTVAFWSNRKAPYLVLEAFLQAFTGDEPVTLVIKTNARDITRWHRHWRNGFRRRHPSPLLAVQKILKRFAHPPEVILIADETMSDAAVLALHRACDCYVSLTRTEGWGLGAFEATLLEKPVVMTSYGGQLDFLDAEEAYLVDYEMVPVHEPTWSANYRPTDLWAAPAIDHAAALMREVFQDPDQAAARAQRLSARNQQRFSKQLVTAALLQALSLGYRCG